VPIADLKERTRLLRRDTFALYLVARHPDTPLPAKVLAACVAAYALSPIDLIPDVVPAAVVVVTVWLLLLALVIVWAVRVLR
jgi:uncharacterized membrane protein YkvA (DUF1232 family)